MPRKLLKRYTPDAEKIKQDKYLRIFARFFEDPYLFHINRRSVSLAFLLGLFWAMIPMPTQMIAVALCAIVIRFNVPIAMALVWLTNPITMPPVFYFNYLVGTWILGEPENVGEFQLSTEWISNKLDTIWQPLYFGSIVVGAICGVVGFIGIRAYWRWYVINKRTHQRPLSK